MLRELLLLVCVLIAPSAAAQVASACEQYQTLITRSALRTFGPDAPIATLAAQLHQESACREAVSSHVGAQGMAQFMPATAADMARLHPQDCSPAAPFSARWAVACRDRYMRGLLAEYTDAATESDQWAFALSAYNGGAGWVRRDRLACDAAPFPAFVDLFGCHICDRTRWWNNVELTPNPRRAVWAITENRGYPRRIMCVLAPRYDDAGWGRQVECPQ